MIMKHRKTLLFMVMIGILIGGFSQAQEQSENFPVLKAGTFSPDGREFFFTRVIEAPYSQIMYIYMYL